MLDGVLVGGVAFALSTFLGLGIAGSGPLGRLEGTGLFLLVALDLAYHVALEARGGQTLGKRICRVRVAGRHGRASLAAIVVRNLLRPLDGALLNVVGLVAIALTGRGRRQRVGDLAAGTVVIAA